jgi:hypothetical protein
MAVAVVLIVFFFLMPETNSANILYRRAQRIRKATGDSRLKSQSEIDAMHVTVKDHLVVLSRAFTLTFSETVVFFVNLYSALIYGVLYIWFESFPLVFGGLYGFNIWQQGLAFLGISVGGLITVPCYLFWIRRYLIPQFSPATYQARGDPSTDLLRRFCTSDLFILVRLDVALGYPLDGTSCGIGLLHYQHNQTVYAGAHLSWHGLSAACSVGACGEHSLQGIMWRGLSAICKLLSYMAS